MDELLKTDEIPEPSEELHQDSNEHGESSAVTRKKHCGEGDGDTLQSSKNINFDEISEGSLELEGECIKRTSFEKEKVDDTDKQHSSIQEDVISEDIEFEDYQDVQEKENPDFQRESDSRSKSVEVISEEEEEEFHDIEDPELVDLEENDNDSQVEIKEIVKNVEENVTEDLNESSNSGKDQSSVIFEEVDSSITDGDKSSNTQDLDIFFDDRTQVIENCDKDNPNNLSNSSVQKEVISPENDTSSVTVNLLSKSPSKVNEENQVRVNNESEELSVNNENEELSVINENEELSVNNENEELSVNNENEELSEKKNEKDSQGKNNSQTYNDDDDKMNVNDFEESQTSDQQQEDMGEIIIASDNEMEEPSVSQQGEETSELIDESPNTQNLLEYDDTIEENIEHVLEPEESDICLIPDREKEVTDAEREQAILVRENAEKEENHQFQDNINQSNEEDVRTNLDQANDETHLDNQETISEQSNKIIISTAVGIQENCIKCNTLKQCGYRYKNPESGHYEFVCDKSCVDQVQNANHGKYVVRRKKFLVEEVGEATAQKCLKCIKEIQCKYFFKYEDVSYYICNDDCFNSLTAEEPDKFKLKRHSIRVRNIGATMSGTKKDKANESESTIVARSASEAEAARLDRAASFLRRCAKCSQEIIKIDNAIHWQTMDFCNEQCLEQYQQSVGSTCKTCDADVSAACISKYCVRFGNELRQFCSVACLTEFKKSLKTCSCCQKDISGNGEGFLASVGDKEQFKDFCSQACMRHYDIICNPKKKLRVHQCAVCNNEKPVRVEILIDKKEHFFCSNPCFSAFKFVSNVVSDQCGMCSKYFERKSNECFTIYTDKRPKVFCCRICLNVFIIVNRKIVSCQWCKVKKYNFDMISKYTNNQNILMCSLNCLTLYGMSVNANSLSILKCDNCNNTETSQYHLTMSDSSLRNFCTYQCVMQFQSKFNRKPLTKPDDYKEQQSVKQITLPYPTGLPKRVKFKKGEQLKPLQTPALPIISTVSSLASGESETMIGSVTVRRSNASRGRGKNAKIKYIEPEPTPTPSISLNTNDVSKTTTTTTAIGTKPVIAKKKPITLSTSNDNLKLDNEPKTKIITVPPLPPKMRNVMTQCKPIMISKEINCKPSMVDTEMQTDDDHSSKILIPVPIPIYVPQPMYMYSAPFPCPIPIPLPIPVPIFIPTTRNSANGIMKEIKKIQDKMPADPFEAELLMMAEMVADEKHDSDSDSDEETKPEPSEVPYTNNVNIEHNQSYGDDVLQMALKMASGDYEEPISVDLESAMRANTISNPPPGIVEQEDANDLGHQIIMLDGQQSTRGRGRKRSSGSSPGTARNNSRTPIKRVRRDTPIIQTHETTSHTLQPTEKPDVNMCLKYTFGVNAWKQWVVTKNIDLEKSSIRRRPFKTELLQMTADELNYSLCLFVKEVRKPNGSEYAPDTIYYLVLGIQQYLYENGRIDNIFTDPYYERFTDCLDEAAQKFSVLYNDSQFIVTRVEEEHLWECKQLGAHSPHVLLSTLMFFNTKHFNLTTVDEHMQLSFSHIMKHWKRTAQNTKSPGARNVLLRFYPPQAGLDANPRKKKVYEQQENEENPLRCPVRLYEFYLSKCPESVKTRNDVFYLQPERSCVPDSPVWYSTQPLSQEALQKMLHRVKMVKEINIALLTS